MLRRSLHLRASMLFLYNIFINAYVAAIKLSSFTNKKAAKWISGRKNLFEKLQKQITAGDKIIWFHCSSAGELEQGLPVVERLNASYPNYKILITFFSPSGMEAAAKHKDKYLLSYIPADTKQNAKRFMQIVQPQLAIFVKYEFWYHHLHAAAFRHVPVLLISAVFRDDQLFFKRYGNFYKQILFLFRHIFVQDPISLRLLQHHSIDHCSVGGDTRFDRVLQNAKSFSRLPLIEQFIQNKQVIVAGSTWADDEKLLAALLKNAPDLKLIIAPHETDESHLVALEKLFGEAVRLSHSIELNNISRKILIVDSVGILSRLYRYATIAYVGGGFTKDGIHNTLEAAVYGKPILFGPNYKKYREAVDLIEAGGAFSIANAVDLTKNVQNLLTNPDALMKASSASKKYGLDNAGATENVFNFIQEKRLLTN